MGATLQAEDARIIKKSFSGESPQLSYKAVGATVLDKMGNFNLN